MLIATRRYSHPLVMPVVVLFALAVFFLSLTLAGGSLPAAIELAMSKGWLLGRLPDTELWRPQTLSLLSEVNWVAIADHSLVMVSVFLISTVSLLLNCSGLEIITRTDIDLNRELKVVGLANILSAGAGSSANYHMLSLSTLNYRLGATTRLAGATVVAVVALTIVFGAGVLASTPKLVLAGFLIYLGLGFLTEWLYDGWYKLPSTDYLLVWAILATIAFVGLLQGVILGVVVAAALFVFAYTRTSLVRHTFTRDRYQSHIMRSPEIEKRLEEKGEGFLVVELQGFVFFGMAHQLLDRIKHRIEDSTQKRLRYLLLDFRLVTGFDSSASYSFSRLLQVASEADITVALSNVAPEVRQVLDKQDNVMSYRLPIFDDLDEAVAWFDNKDLMRADAASAQLPLIAHLQQSLPVHSESVSSVEERVSNFMQHLEMKAGTVLLNEGDTVEYVYFIESGEVSIKTIRPGKKSKVLRVQSAGTVFGEIGIYASDTATATVVVSKDAELYRMSAGDLKRLDDEDPQLSIVVHRLIARTLGRKLRQVNYALVALHD
jgi:SulP family sulfate permease